MSYQNKHLTCSGCSRSFVFSAEEQGLSGELGFDAPKRCRTCRLSREDSRRELGRANVRPRLAGVVTSAIPIFSLPVAVSLPA